MSDKRRSNPRRYVRKQHQTSKDESLKMSEQIASNTLSSSRYRPTSNKRTRLESVTPKKSNEKKKKDTLDESDDDDDDDDDIEEIVPDTHLLDKTEIDRCPICLDDCTDAKHLEKCGHIFCTDCIDHYFQSVKPQCPCCFTIYGELRGNQPLSGTMQIETYKHRLPGFEHDSRGTIRITYHFPNGIQDECHPSPGMPYHGTTRQAFLPENREGRHVLTLLQKAFELRQIFTVGQSRTTGHDNVITWNDIHHKTSVNGGVENFGYPDKTYLNRVKQELAAKGIK